MIKYLFRSKSPLRIGLAGGGTDVSPYSDEYGGAILNATINYYAYASIEIDALRLNNGWNHYQQNVDGNRLQKKIKLEIKAEDQNTYMTFALDEIKPLPVAKELPLHIGVFNRIVRDYPQELLSKINAIDSEDPVPVISLSTSVDVPAGSGLGTSSTLVVAILGAFAEWLKLPLGEYDLAHLAYQIERVDLGLAGGKQDQYAATFGGFNFIEFYSNDNVIVNPLRIKQEYINELEYNLILFYTGRSRSSAQIINDQSQNVALQKVETIRAMHKMKEQAFIMKEAILKGNIDQIGRILHTGWQYKKQSSDVVTTPAIDALYETALDAGATGGKISGAGGGGFIFFYCPSNTKYKVMDALKNFDGEISKYQFTRGGLSLWTIKTCCER